MERVRAQDSGRVMANVSPMRRSRILALLCLAATLVPLASHAAAPLPLIDTETGTGGRWVSYRFTTDGSVASFDISALEIARGEHIGVYFYDESNVLKAGLAWISVGWKSGSTFRLPAAGVDIGVVESPDPDGGMRILLTLNDPAFPPILTGTYKVLMFAAGDAQSWNYSVRGTGISDLVKDLGDRTFLYLSDDFEAAANAAAHARVPLPPEAQPWVGSVSNVGARVTVDGSFAIDVRDTLMLNFGSVAFAPSQTFSIDSPDGPIDCGFYGCGFNRFEGPYHHGAGRYTFHTTGVNAGLSYMAELVLSGADARLP